MYYGLGNPVGIATSYGLVSLGIETRWGAKFSAPVQTCPGAHPVFYTIGTGSLPWVKGPKRGADHSWTSAPHLGPRGLLQCDLYPYLYIYISSLLRLKPASPQPHPDRRHIWGMWRRVASEGAVISVQTVPIHIYTVEATANFKTLQKITSTTSQKTKCVFIKLSRIWSLRLSVYSYPIIDTGHTYVPCEQD